MATPQEIERALRAAHAAGDTKSAQLLAREYRRARSNQDFQTATTAGANFLTGPVAQGMTAGAADEMRAGLTQETIPALLEGGALPALANISPLGAVVNIASRTLPRLFGEDTGYEQQRDALRQEQERYAQENPVANIAGNLLGTIVTGAPAGAIGAGTRLGQAAANLARSRPLLGAAGVGAGVGATEGALSGAGEAETLADVPRAAGEGALLGGGLGAVGGPVAEGVTRAARGLLGNLTPEARARESIRQAMADVGVTTPEQAAARLGQGGVLGDIVPDELRFLSQAPGATAQLAEDTLEPRSMRQISQLEDMIGKGQKNQVLDDIAAQRARDVRPLYQQAYATETPMTPELERLWQSDTVQRIWKSGAMKRRASAIATAENLPYSKAMFDTETPSTMGWDYLVRGLDAEINALKRRSPSDAVPLQRIRRQIMEEVRAQNPALAAARSAFAGGEQFKDAMALGEKAFNMRASDFTREFDNLAEGNRDAFKTGLVQAVNDKLQSQSDLHDLTKFFRNPSMRRKMATLFDTPEELAEFNKQIDLMAQQQRTFGKTRGGSQTAPLMMRSDIAAMRERAGLISRILTGEWKQALQQISTAVDPTMPSTAARDAAGRMLLEQAPQAQQQLLQQMLAPSAQSLLPGAAGGLLAPMAAPAFTGLIPGG